MILKAIVPMKAHSERVPDKNIRLLHNKPLFYWIFNTLNTVPAIQSIILDTDSDVIADHVLKYFPKTEISYRPKELQGDFVSVNSIIENIINNDPLTEYYIQTHSTNPCL
ncbi:MAG TPA: acylneuraminate cytidylyltransferase family protein, partial [Candidatus Cloacimonadota bacterium]|nr:acylneuraminate cytidylyltransferase family protein [Candidatus Cloacimonadota bacterium]